MTTPAPYKQLNRLTGLLQELFQLNQPELEFGLYKIMHARSQQIQKYLEQDLLCEVTTAFGSESAARLAQAQQQLDLAITQAIKFGAPDPEATPGVQEARAAFNSAKDGGNSEAEVYDHLYRFFERYYDSGDFLSRRYYARETDTRSAPYSVPYDGREVYLHWANKDQYYIKSSEALNNYSFDLRQAVQLHGAGKAEAEFDFGQATDDASALRRVHFRIASAAEGEHGNIKAAADQKRVFLPLLSQPIAWDGDTELVLQFEYKPMPDGLPITEATEAELKERYGFSAKEPLAAHWMADVFIQALQSHPHPLALDYAHHLAHPAPTDKQKKRPLLARYIAQYTARNTMDYFIHKDLGGFLRRELDFYLKNEVMRLDDIAHADAPKVESYLERLKVLRRIAHHLIDFLAQLEDFQKKLWLKKKFVTAAHYCITLDRIPSALYPAIAANDAQRTEWVRLFAIDEITADDTHPGYSLPLTVVFLEANPFLLVDTGLFDEAFEARLLDSIDNLDAQCDGVLMHSENFQALELMQAKYKQQVQCVHIDPPYNTSTSGFIYKNSYQHSSWLTMLLDRVKASTNLLNDSGQFICHIDENEYENLFLLTQDICTNMTNAGTVIWDKRNPMTGGKGVALQHEYLIWYTKKNVALNFSNSVANEILKKVNELIGKYGCVNKELRTEYTKWLSAKTEFSGGEKAYRYIDDSGSVYQSVSLRAPEPRTDEKFHLPLIHPITKKPCAVPPNGFSRTPDTLKKMIADGNIIFGEDETTQPRQKSYLSIETSRQLTSVISDGLKGKADIEPMNINFPYCHPVGLYESIFSISTTTSELILDYFAGSGTTAHAVLNLNRKFSSRIKFLLVEGGIHFESATKPRVQKAVYSKDWKDGKPFARDGISHCFKYLRLESYEDTLNNLVLHTDPARERALADQPSLAKDYLLHYWLDVETRGSQSLLNVAAFRDPTAYRMQIKQPGSEAQTLQRIDLVETFNWLIGLWVQHLGAPVTLTAEFEREPDPELPGDTQTRLLCTRLRPASDGPYWFRMVEGYTLTTPGDDSSRQPTLVVWRKLSDDPERDNAVLQHFLLEKLQISPREQTFAVIYVNGSHTLPNPVVEGEQIRVRLIEEAFHQAMWSQAGA
jgi:adenine-specific DNA-methyltransferase